MSKIIRLNESDIEKLVRKIISEEKSLNENKLFDWVRSKRFSDEEMGRDILKGVQAGEAQNVRPIGGNTMNNAGMIRRVNGFDFSLANHNMSIQFRREVQPGVGGRLQIEDTYYLFVDGEFLKISRSIANKIYNELKNPTAKKPDLKTSLGRYNMSKEERQKMEDPETYFPESYIRNKKQK